MSPAEEILVQFIEELGGLFKGDHRPGDCPLADPASGACDVCAVLDNVTELINECRDRLERLRLGIGVAA